MRLMARGTLVFPGWAHAGKLARGQAEEPLIARSHNLVRSRSLYARLKVILKRQASNNKPLETRNEDRKSGFSTSVAGVCLREGVTARMPCEG